MICLIYVFDQSDSNLFERKYGVPLHKMDQRYKVP